MSKIQSKTPNPKSIVIVAQVFISCFMALLMTFCMSIVLPGTIHESGWFATWMQRWLTAWPLAFLFSLGVGPLAFKLSTLVNGTLARLSAQRG
ncbi:DUF2798 domain-containing protein [Pseudooceanicola sp. CBS1P-1]|uniref:DUF2798 domain-containing protein n=1 Tax=Pseudooceanicola albus TaxID=2692189 RepID=A0A6L7G4I4_9RHOB|nr:MULTISPECIES: DUF2798 domain-containing protein [Pseudooceanicola]MBT9383699.1 DUF2798 domain-containing protein [Pseudooceanicola endophyticus]MXN17553.1 DUF2798 domain-containing protein [Pseudooceanicola albus]